jgi:hypothetical protein
MSISEAGLAPGKRRPRKKRIETAAKRKKRIAKDRAARKDLRARLAEDPDAVFTFKEWCGVNSFSFRLGRQILNSGEGPPVIRFSERRIGISRAANREWLASRAQKRG